jgi:uncharacterized cysteine cluster protein YcgN (CxxCxxCC family)
LGDNNRFWETKSLQEMSKEEWESLCDGCARCCLLKLEDEETAVVYYTQIHCYLLDRDKCQCSKYLERNKLVPDCVLLTPDNLEELSWMPSTCAYRLLHEGKPLPDWHPLVSGTQKSVHDAGISIRSYAIPEQEINSNELPHYLIDWLK